MTCARRRASSKGAFYGYFKQKQDVLLALLEDDRLRLMRELERITQGNSSGVERVRRFAQVMLARGDDPARVQVRADLWAELLTDDGVRGRLAEATQRRRELVRSWIEEAVSSGELVAIPANALASILLALTDGLMLHGALDPGGVSLAQYPPRDRRDARRHRGQVKPGVAVARKHAVGRAPWRERVQALARSWLRRG